MARQFALWIHFLCFLLHNNRIRGHNSQLHFGATTVLSTKVLIGIIVKRSGVVGGCKGYVSFIYYGGWRAFVKGLCSDT